MQIERAQNRVLRASRNIWLKRAEEKGKAEYQIL